MKTEILCSIDKGKDQEALTFRGEREGQKETAFGEGRAAGRDAEGQSSE